MADGEVEEINASQGELPMRDVDERLTKLLTGGGNTENDADRGAIWSEEHCPKVYLLQTWRQFSTSTCRRQSRRKWLPMAVDHD